jgi:protein-S-isoprenylcysteine O-methyltransferase Ste14
MKAALSVIGYVAMAVGLVWLLMSHSIFSTSPIVITGQLLAFAVMIWARVSFGRRSFHAAATPTEGGLVTTGPYRFIRHPIYASVCVFIWVSVLGHASLQSVALASLVSLGAAIRVVIEEELVAQRYPEYRDYAKRTKRLIPFVF